MKLLSVTFLALCLVFCGCDYVDVPTQNGGTNTGGSSGITRRILIEEFTGHTCPTCPAAAITLHNIENLYPDQVMIIAIHTGWFGDPCPPHPLPSGAVAGDFAEDFTTGTSNCEGTEYDQTFSGIAPQPPGGLVNRLGFPSGTFRKEQGSWASITDSLLGTPAVAGLEFDTVIYNSVTHQLDFSIDGQFISAQNGSFNIAIMLVEDSLTGWQINGQTNVPDYTFMHVLRACVNTPGSIVGSPVSSGAIAAGSNFSYDLPATYTVNSNWHTQHCKLIAFIYNTSTQEVLQAAEAELE